MKKWLFILITIALVSVAVGYFGFSFYVASKLVAPVRDFIDYSPATVSGNWEKVSFKTKDGLALKGWFFPAKSDKVILVIPGYSANWANSNHAGVLIYKDLLAAGYSVMAIDNRAHGESEGQVFSYGLKESGDVLEAFSYLQSRGYAPVNIGILADSTGTVSTLMAIEGLKDSGPIILDSAASVFKPFIFNILVKEKGVWPVLLPGVDFVLKHFWNINLDLLRPVDKIAAAKNKDLLLLHGDRDVTVALAESQRLLSVAGPGSKLVIFPGAKHVASYRSDPDLFRKEVFGFIDKSWGKQ